jgi:hypothetical protein
MPGIVHAALELIRHALDHGLVPSQRRKTPAYVYES